ncbi:MAG: winged helix-turn-helix transcriptional regulator [Caulobacteraceae bacterium]|nr:winged helix-turn-helix transcriptional regulator [Caulobacteraceae bacterium]
MDSPQAPPVTLEQYRALAAFRHQLRRFLAFSSREAEAAGYAPQQYQALLAIKGHAGDRPISIGELADQLLVRQHSAAELVNRMQAAGLVRRAATPGDARRVAVLLTDQGEEALRRLAPTHLRELTQNEGFVARLLALLNTMPS